MLIISYDISNDKLRTKFAKYLSKYGRRIQYSIFEIENSERFLNIITNDIKNRYEKLFSETDSVIIFNLSNKCEITKYGYAKNEDKDFIIV